MSHFTENEFKCNCSCGMDVQDALKAIIDDAREVAGIPFVITSGARCLNYNRTIGSKDTSSHVRGLAVDIQAKTSRDRFTIINSLMVAGITRIGINFNKGFIHADMDYDKPQDLIFGY